MRQNEHQTTGELTQAEIDTVIDGLEQAGNRMDEDDFRERYGDMYQKPHVVENEDSDNEYRVK